MSQRSELGPKPLPRSCFLLLRPGSEVVDWLHRNVEGFVDRREARKYAGNLLKAGYIRHTVNKVTFSEQCYYVFGDVCAGEDSGCRRRSLCSGERCCCDTPVLTHLRHGRLVSAGPRRSCCSTSRWS